MSFPQQACLASHCIADPFSTGNLVGLRGRVMAGESCQLSARPLFSPRSGIQTCNIQ